jgi:zinc transport system substrate-binding protein
MKKSAFFLYMVFSLFVLFFAGCQGGTQGKGITNRIQITASDTLLSGMSEALLPSDRFEVAVILPPGQCPGHYDLKLSDIALVKNADLVVSFRYMPFMQGAEIDENRLFSVDSHGMNWMVPDAYIAGLETLAAKFSEFFPESAPLINERKDLYAREIVEKNAALTERIKNAGVGQKPVIASSMIREPLEWMGFRVAGEYDRPESISAKEIADLVRTGKAGGAVLVADNLQSGPDAGKGISEALGVSHVILANFPLENGYAATLEDNVDAVLAVMRVKLGDGKNSN